jgi:hypothetical protein
VPTRANYATIDAFVQPNLMFQITKSTSHELGIPGLQHTLGVLTNKAKQHLFYVVPDTVFWKVRSIPVKPAASAISPTVQIWILETDWRKQHQHVLTLVRACDQSRLRRGATRLRQPTHLYVCTSWLWLLLLLLHCLQEDKRNEVVLRLELKDEQPRFIRDMLNRLHNERLVDAFLGCPTGYRSEAAKPSASTELGWVSDGELYLSTADELVWVQRAPTSKAYKDHFGSAGGGAAAASAGGSASAATSSEMED